jgi:hypothetical protein
MINVFIKRRNLDTDTQEECRLEPYYHNHQKLGGWPETDASVAASEGTWPFQDLELRHVAPTAGRE